MTTPDQVHDPGLARERTELAWRRTAIAFTALGGALVKMDLAIGLPALAISTLLWDLGCLSRSRTPHSSTRRPLRATVAIVAASLITLAAVLDTAAR